MQRRGWIGVGVAAVAVIAIAGVGVAAKMRQAQDNDKKPEVTLEFTPREIASLREVTMPVVVDLSGPLVAPGTAVLRARAAGTLVALSVAEGDRVASGQVLGRIDPAEWSSRVAEREAMLASAQAALAQAERTHASNQRLADQQFISGSALDTSRAALETAQAQVRAARASLDTTRVASRETTLVAPIAGVVGKRHVLPGEKVSVEQQVLTIVNLRRLEMAATVGTHEVALLRTGMPVALRVEGYGGEMAGTLTRIAPAAEAGTRSIGVFVEVPNAKETLRAGQYAAGRIVLDDPTARPSLPITAVSGSAGAEHVWVLDNGALLRRSVTTGRRDEKAGRVEVLQGLDARTQVLAARYDNLREGAKAVVVSPAAPVASASSAVVR